MTVEEVADDGSVRKTHELPFAYSMMLPAFRGVGAVRGIEKLTNPRGFVIVDKHQRNPAYPERLRASASAWRSRRSARRRFPVGVPKTGFMIESMVTATAMNIGALLKGQAPSAQPTWNAICLADFGDTGVAFLAHPQIPPRNVNWSSKGEWVHSRQGRVREILPAEDPARRERAVLRALPARQAQHRENQGGKNGDMSARPIGRLRHIAARPTGCPPNGPPAAARCGSCHRPIFSGHPVEVDEAASAAIVREQRHPAAGRRLGALVRAVPRHGADVRARRTANSSPDVRLLKLNSDNAPAVSSRLGISGIPTLLLDARWPGDRTHLRCDGRAAHCGLDEGRACAAVTILNPN